VDKSRKKKKKRQKTPRTLGTRQVCRGLLRTGEKIVALFIGEKESGGKKYRMEKGKG